MSGIVFGEARANLNSAINLSGTVLTAYLSQSRRNKTGILCRVNSNKTYQAC